jgi:hypothetical protein
LPGAGIDAYAYIYYGEEQAPAADSWTDLQAAALLKPRAKSAGHAMGVELEVRLLQRVEGLSYDDAEVIVVLVRTVP